MISITGTLSIKAVNGSKGSFCVGDLSTSVGTFKVKDAILDQYSPGDYDGTFVIEEIFPSSYTWRGKVWVEVRARLSAIHVESEPETPDTETLPESVEPDPANENRPVQETAVTPDPGALPAAPTTATALFDTETHGLIEAGNAVKLAPPVDRGLVRAQRDALKGHGYRFDASTQMWELPAE